MRRILLAIVLTTAAAPALAKMQTKPVEWQVEGQTFSGVLVYDDAAKKPMPGLVMFPNWRGVNESAVEKAKKIAGDDYVVLVADMYGAGIRPKDNAEAGKQAGALYADVPRMRARAKAALDALRGQQGVRLDAARIGAFGFCFGGSNVIELVRAGEPLAGAVSLHGGLNTTHRARPGTAKTPLLVLNGAADKAVTAADKLFFQQEMDAAGADWQFVDFSGAVHCFAEADAGNDPASNCRYDARAAKRAYEAMADFFEQRFDD